MARLLRINNEDVDIDESTAIGLDLQCYDVKEPSKRLVNITNNFTLPLTARNNKLFGYPSNPQTLDKTIYSPLSADYWNDNIQLIDKSIVRIDEVSDRVTCYLVQKQSVWDELKLLTWNQFAKEVVAWLNPQLGTYESVITQASIATEGLFLPQFMGQLMNHQASEGSAYTEDIANIWLQYKEINGGHFCIYAKTIFQFIEYKYNVKFLTNGGEFAHNLWSDKYASAMYEPIRNIGVKAQYSATGANEGFKLAYIGDEFKPLDCGDKSDRTVYDYVQGFFQIFNVIKDEVGDEIRLYRWDEIEDADVIDWSNKLAAGQIKFKPSLNGFTQNNRIKFSSIYEGGSEDTGSRNITCQNKNLDAKSDLFTINAHIPNYVQGYGGVIPNLSESKSFEQFQYFITGYESEGNLQRTTATIAVNFDDTVTTAYHALYLQIPSVYSIQNEYLLLEKALQYPIYREVSVWLTIYDIVGLQFFKQYYFKQLGGCYFLNKISGFNPDKSQTPTKLELFKISDKSPATPPNTDYYADGVSEGFTDGENDLFY